MQLALLIQRSKLYLHPNVIFAHHLLASSRQQPGDTLCEFLREFHKLSKDCNIRAVSAEEYREKLKGIHLLMKLLYL